MKLLIFLYMISNVFNKIEKNNFCNICKFVIENTTKQINLKKLCDSKNSENCILYIYRSKKIFR